MKTKKRYFEVYTQIIVLIVATISLSYFMHESSIPDAINTEEKVNSLSGIVLFLLRVINKIIWNEKTLVSALNPSIFTCVKTKNGEPCKEFFDSNSCSDACNGSCSSEPASQVAGCEIGSCYDPIGGTCQLNSRKGQCTDGGGNWITDPNGNVQECKKGCCLIGDNAYFVTGQSCTRMSNLGGIQKIFKPEITTEYECSRQLQLKVEGACITGKDSFGMNTCVFTTKEKCFGSFHSGVLCSNPELETNCKRQQKTGCVQGKDGVYWLDSCENPENIYDSSKEASWNNGMVLSTASCSLDFGNDLLANQKTCGDCNRLLSSVCGSKTETEYLSSGAQDFVCRSLTCKDRNGIIRRNGESWCEYQGEIGVVGGKRAVDTPGSRHFSNLCTDGEIQTTSCGEYRVGICVGSPTIGETIGTGRCISNLGVECIGYNIEDNKVGLCNKNPACWVKTVNVDRDFSFNLCVAKYPIGHELQTGQGSSACSLASQKCIAVKVKELWHGWEWKYNQHCRTSDFAVQMNDLCMSLGDCGAEVNYQGTRTDNYQVSRSPWLSSSYLNEIEQYDEISLSKVAPVPDVGAFYGSMGLPSNLGQMGFVEDYSDHLKALSQISGGIGLLLLQFGKSIGLATAGTGAVTTTVSTVVGETTMTQVTQIPAVPSALSATGGVIAGAAIGLAITSWIINAVGIGAGLDRGALYTLMTLGAVSGGFLGYEVVTGTLAWGAPGVIIAIILLVIIGILKLFGIGKVKKYVIEFNCYPWQPVRGGNKCETCGNDGLPCSAYECSSLGQTCRFISENEGTTNAMCVDDSPNDLTPPVITFVPEALSSGFGYEEFDSGVKIKNNANDDGCIEAYSKVKFGLNLDEYGRCRYSTFPNIAYEDMIPSDTEEGVHMGDDLSIGFQKNITVYTRMPSLIQLNLPNYDPSKRADYSMYVKCENGKGDFAERDYAINFCIKPGNDSTPPAIERIEPEMYVRANTNNQTVNVWTNEPTNCKWDGTDKDYGVMINSFSCANEFDEQTLWGWKCDTTMPITSSENKFYIRCEDKPWEENETNRNMNAESTNLTLKKTVNLLIDSASPNNVTIKSSIEPVSVNVEVKTSGGLDSTALCGYSFDGESYIDLRYTLSSIHSQRFESFVGGQKTIWLKCEDAVGNLAYKNITFNIEVDTEAPKITRIYHSTGGLIIKTNEPASCALSTVGCSFDYENGTLMYGSNILHSLSIEKNRVYYVKCKDGQGNVAGVCSSQFKVV